MLKGTLKTLALFAVAVLGLLLVKNDMEALKSRSDSSQASVPKHEEVMEALEYVKSFLPPAHQDPLHVLMQKIDANPIPREKDLRETIEYLNGCLQNADDEDTKTVIILVKHFLRGISTRK